MKANLPRQLLFASLAVMLPSLLLGACAGTPDKQEGIWFPRDEAAELRARAERDKQGQEDVLRVQRFFEAMPRCESRDVAGAVEVTGITLPTGEGELRVRGFLSPTHFACNAAGWIEIPGKGPPRCANECHGLWFITAPGATRANAVLLKEESPAAPMKGAELLDCAVSDLEKTEAVPLPEVIAVGSAHREVFPGEPEVPSQRRGFWWMSVSRLCALESPSARVFTKDVREKAPYVR